MKKILLLGIVMVASLCASFAKIQEPICILTVKSPAQTCEKLKSYISAVDSGAAMIFNLLSATSLGAPNYSGVDKDSSMAICVFMNGGNPRSVLAINASEFSAPAMSAKSSQKNFLRLDEWLTVDLANDADILPPKTFADFAYETVKAAKRGSLNSDISISINIPSDADEAIKDTLTTEYSKIIRSALEELRQIKINFNLKDDNLDTQIIFKAKEGSSFAEAINAAPLRVGITETGFIDESKCAALSWGGIDFKKAIKPFSGVLDTFLKSFYPKEISDKLSVLIYGFIDSGDGTFASAIYEDSSTVNVYKNSADFDSAFEMNYLLTKISLDYSKIFNMADPKAAGIVSDMDTSSGLNSEKQIFPENKFGAQAGLIKTVLPSSKEVKLDPISNYIAKKDGYLFYASTEKALSDTLSRKPSKAMLGDCDVYIKIYPQKYAKIYASILGKKLPATTISPDPIEARTYFGDNRISMITSIKASNMKAISDMFKSSLQTNAGTPAGAK